MSLGEVVVIDVLLLLEGATFIRCYLRFRAMPAKLAAHFIMVDGQFVYFCRSLLLLPGWPLLLIDLHS